MPRFSGDDVLDFMVTEAVIAHAREDAEDAQEKADKNREREAWKKNTEGLPDG